MNTFKHIMRGWFCGPNNDYPEAGRALWFASVVAAIGYTGAHLFINGEFSIVEFGTGIGGLIAAGGWGIGAKDKAAKEARG